MYRVALTALGAALACGLTSRDVRAEHRTRAYLGVSVSPLLNAASARVGEETYREGEFFEADVELAASRSVLGDRLALRGSALFGSSFSDWSSNRGERRGHLDLTVGPEYRIVIPHVAFRFALPFGYSNAWISTDRGGRLVRETYDGGHGVAFAAVTGLDLWGNHHGGYFNLSYFARINWFEHTAVLKADARVRSTEAFRLLRHGLVLGVGYTARF